jgi:hypothetical protein
MNKEPEVTSQKCAAGPNVWRKPSPNTATLIRPRSPF